MHQDNVCACFLFVSGRGLWCWVGPCVRDRDLSVLEGMMSQHQNLKSKIDNKSKTFVHCVEMGKMLLAARNPAAEEVDTYSNTEPFVHTLKHANAYMKPGKLKKSY